MSCPCVSTECAICLVSFRSTTKNLHTTDCGHTFHSKCFDKIKSDYCPCCRTPVTKSSVRLIAESKITYKNANAKLNAFNKKIIDGMKRYKNIVDKSKALVSQYAINMNNEIRKNRCDANGDNAIISKYELLIQTTKDKISDDIHKINKHDAAAHSARIHLKHAAEIAWANMITHQMNEFNA
jgi:hypothetical protein